MNIKYRILSLVCVLGSAILAGLPLLHAGLPPTHDGEYHVIRFYQFNKVIQDGVLYPRWAPDLNNGYGVPLFNYVYPFPNYVASFLHIFGISFIDAFKLNLLFATLLGAVFFYVWTKEIVGEIGGIVASIFYSFAPYRFVDIYVRGSVGEVWALAFFPAFLWSISRLIKLRQRNHIFISGLFLALLIFSHNILGLLFFCFSLSYIGLLLMQGKKEKRNMLLDCLYSISFGLGLSALFWFPALTESSQVRGLQIFDVSRNFADLYQLLIPSWGSGFSGNGLQDQMSFQIGIANLLIAFVSFIFLFKQIKKRQPNFAVALLFFIWFTISILLMLPYSAFIWQTIPLLPYFQFPWRFLSVTIVSNSFLAGYSISFIHSRNKRIVIAVISVLLAIGTTISYTRPAYYHYRDDNHYISRSNFIDGTNSPGNSFNTLWFDANLLKAKEKIVIEKGKGSVVIEEAKSTYYTARITAAESLQLTANIAYFPGWTVDVNNKTIHSSVTKDGRIGFQLPKGDHVVSLSFRDTISRAAAKMISGLSLIILAAFLIRKAQQHAA